MIRISVSYKAPKSEHLEEVLQQTVKSYKGHLGNFSLSSSLFEAAGEIPSQEQFEALDRDLQRIEPTYKSSIEALIVSDIP